MTPKSFERVIRAMVPTSNRLDAEAALLGALRLHRSCRPGHDCTCGLLDAAGQAYMAMAYHAHGHALEKLLESWIEVAKAYDRGEGLDGPARKLYATGVMYRLLLS